MLGKGNYEYAATLYGHRHPVLIDLLNESNEVLSRYYTNISRSGNVIQAEAEYVNTQGDLITLFIKACPLYDNEGNITGYIESVSGILGVKRICTKR